MNEELQELVRSPREDLDIELKQWMDLDDKLVQAKFAKELLALRNHGGGYLVIGFQDQPPHAPDPNRPASLSSFNTDVFNNIIKKYAEPPFHCSYHLVAHPETGHIYPVVVVPGGGKVPVRCRADSPDEGKSARLGSYYIRRPGPESSAPQSAAEWDALLERCLLNRKDELLTSLSTLLGASGATRIGLPEPVHPFTKLRKFRDEAVARLEALQAELKPGDPASLQHGRYMLSARIVGDIRPLTPKQVLDVLSQLRRYTGWSPLYVFTGNELAPYPIGDDIAECWLARDEARDAGHADFWRVSTRGFVTLIRGYHEDAPDMAGTHGAPPVGRGIELTLPPWRLGEFLLRVRELGERLATSPFRIQIIAQWEGLNGRQLFSHGHQRHLSLTYVAHEPTYSVELEVSPEQIDSSLPQVVATAVTPLMRRFSFFEPPASLYDDEIAKMMRRQFV